jgi:hypothetical protein
VADLFPERERFDAPGASARAKANEQRPAPGSVESGGLGRRDGASSAGRSWTRGAVGEEVVAGQLGRLELHGWTVLHDLPIGSHGANIDHLVLGPGGVFSINTKNFSGRTWIAGGTFLVGGRHHDHIPAAAREAARIERHLRRATGIDVSVTGLIVVLAPQVTVKRQPDDVQVLTRRTVVPWLRSKPTVLPQHHLDALTAAARTRATWT